MVQHPTWVQNMLVSAEQLYLIQQSSAKDIEMSEIFAQALRHLKAVGWARMTHRNVQGQTCLEGAIMYSNAFDNYAVAVKEFIRYTKVYEIVMYTIAQFSPGIVSLGTFNDHIVSSYAKAQEFLEACRQNALAFEQDMLSVTEILNTRLENYEQYVKRKVSLG